jgi:hypothetical protein
MANKRFGAQLIPAAQKAIIMSGATNAVCVLTIANQGLTQTRISVGYIDSTNIGDLSPEDFLIRNHVIPAGEFFQIKGIAVENGNSIVVETLDEAVSAVAYGIDGS